MASGNKIHGVRRPRQGRGKLAVYPAPSGAALFGRSKLRHGRRRQAGALHIKSAFTLIELMAVLAAIAVLLSLLLPALAKSAGAGRGAVCANNLKNLHAAYVLYLGDHENKFFRYVEDADAGRKLYYFGLSDNAGAEGERGLDMSKAKLAPYLGDGGGVEICPSMPYRASNFKKKYAIASYGYGINAYMLAGHPLCTKSGITSFGGISKPSETIAWADAIQINQFQAPASPSNPMLEEWFYLDGMRSPSDKYHFRHNLRVNVILADGSVKSMPPKDLDERCDGRVGALEAKGEDYWLRTRK